MVAMKPVRSKIFNGREVVGFMSEDAFKRFDWLIETYDIKTIIELGSFVGLSTCYFAERVDRIYTVDNFDVYSQDYPNYVKGEGHVAAAQDQYREFLRNTLPFDNIVGLKMDFMEAVDVLPEVDMVYIDAVQSYKPFRAVLDAYLPKARKVIAGDDAHLSRDVVLRVAKELGGEAPPGERTWWKAL